jgi:nucleoside-diphosphate-sugar epimerase
MLHFAWYTAPGKYWTAIENLEWVRASLALLRSFAESGGQRVVMAGTCAEYDWTGGFCSEETTALSPSTLYGTCKHALQIMLDKYARQVQLSAAWGRLFYPYGPRERPKRFVSSVIRALLKNEPALCSHGNQQRDFLFVEDAAAAFVALLESDVRGPVNIASGQAVALSEIAYRIGEMLNRSELVHLGAISAGPEDPPLLVADVKRLEKEVGWIPRFDLDRGLARTVEWWKQSMS